MATITITIPDAVVGRVLDAFDGVYDGRTKRRDGELVELYTKPQWAKLHVIRYISTITRQWESEEAVRAIEEVPGIESE